MQTLNQSHQLSHTFNQEGFIPAAEYVEDIERMKKGGLWKIPLNLKDRLRLSFLRIFLRFFKLKNMLYVPHLHAVSPGYSLLVSYLKIKGFLDSFEEKNASVEGFFCFQCLKSVTFRGRSWNILGEGISPNKEEAFSKAIGELIERLISGIYDENTDIRIDSMSRLSLGGHPLFYPPKYHRLLDVQKRTHASYVGQENRPIRWVSGTNLITKKRTYIPKRITSWFSGNYDQQELIFNATTSGTAGFFTKEGAILRGLLESVQRDAFLVHWLTCIPPLRIKQATLPLYLQEKLKKFQIKGYTTHLLDMTTLHIPSMCLLVMNEGAEASQVIVAASTAVTMEKAIDESLDEATKMLKDFLIVRDDEKRETGDDFFITPFVNNMKKEERQKYWRGKDKVKEIQWFVTGEVVTYERSCEKNLKSAAEDDNGILSECLSILEKFGEDYYPVVYFPKNDIQDKLCFYVAQVYIPKAFPLYLVEKYGTFDSDRLSEFALSKNKKNWKLNPTPHPFL